MSHAIHVAAFPNQAERYEVSIGAPGNRRRPVARFKHLTHVEIVLRGLRHLARKRASLKVMAVHLNDGAKWAALRASET